ncbi:MAG: 30S ribosomal protein S3 [Candidatus Moraniibacteriota bacterium]|nr:MAG: 30S ribosomal protein S3 [Candidatus Moranbacteria bacterium]
MGQKVNPKSLRIGITTDWRSRWFGGNNYAKLLEQDVFLRREVMKKYRHAAIADVEVERNAKDIRVIVRTSRPGMIIGRGGSGIEDLVSFIKKTIFPGKKVDIKVDIKEIKQYEESAALVAQNVAEQLEKRMPFRRVLKTTLEQAAKNRNIKGMKIQLSGRLNGAEMSRVEWLSHGTIPLHTLRADIDFARDVARTTYGAIGIKVWVYKGEIFKGRKEDK